MLVVASAIVVTLCYRLWSKASVDRGLIRGIAGWLAAAAVSYGPWFVLKRAWGLKNDLLEDRAQLLLE